MTANPIELQKHLKGLDYPADKDAVVSRAEDNGAPDEVLETLRDLPGKSYESPADLMKAYGKE